MRIIITGSRHLDDYDLVYRALLRYAGRNNVTVVHGGAPGADTLAAEIAEGLGFNVESYPADWSIGKKAGPLRNQHMVDLGAKICLAFPTADSRGTWDCVNRAKDAGIKVKIITEAP